MPIIKRRGWGAQPPSKSWTPLQKYRSLKCRRSKTTMQGHISLLTASQPSSRDHPLCQHCSLGLRFQPLLGPTRHVSRLPRSAASSHAADSAHRPPFQRPQCLRVYAGPPHAAHVLSKQFASRVELSDARLGTVSPGIDLHGWITLRCGRSCGTPSI
jgi:hypothetical protein